MILDPENQGLITSMDALHSNRIEIAMVALTNPFSLMN